MFGGEVTKKLEINVFRYYLLLLTALVIQSRYAQQPVNWSDRFGTIMMLARVGGDVSAPWPM